MTNVAVTIGVLTYKRADGLIRTLASLDRAQEFDLAVDWHIDEVVIIDNDRTPSAASVVAAVAADGHSLSLRHVHEATPGLAAARNRALDEAKGQILVFIDDDEVAETGWPGGLVDTMQATGAALVGGPVRTAFTHESAPAIAALFDRDEPPEGSDQRWLRSGNLAIDLEKIRANSVRFDPAFAHSGGEDVAFSWQVKAAGLGLRWTNTAPVTEFVGPERTTMRWVMKRERASSSNWVRVETGHHGSIRHKGYIAARGLVRIGQGLLITSAGVVTANRSRLYRGLAMAAKGMGTFEGLANRARANYG
jgi:succinoglycan biosynthesis protein ExoM